MQFSSDEEYAKYFGKYLKYYREDGIYDSKNIDDYVKALKHGGYFGDSLENYLSDVKKIFNENFPDLSQKESQDMSLQNQGNQMADTTLAANTGQNQLQSINDLLDDFSKNQLNSGMVANQQQSKGISI